MRSPKPWWPVWSRELWGSPSDSGKSVTLNLIGRLLEPDSEEIVIEEEGHKPKPAFMFQNHRLLPWAMVKDNIGFVMDSSIGRAQHLQMIDKVLGMVGLAEFKNYYPHQISGGPRYRNDKGIPWRANRSISHDQRVDDKNRF